MTLALCSMTGCKQQLFITEPDYDHYKVMGEKNLESDPSVALIPPRSDIPKPMDIHDPERKLRFVTMSECIQSALEKGTTGVQSPFFPGAITDLLGSFSGTTFIGSDSIRVLALQPAIVANNIEASVAKFDAHWISNLNWTTSDIPVGTALQTFQAFANRVPNIQQDNATLSSTLVKPLPTGGVAGITFQTQYNLSNLAQRVNPAYQTNLNFTFEQPLLQGFGVEINQLRASHPGSILNPFSSSARVEGILITRIRFDQQRAEFERNINFLLLNVELAYWNLYGSYWTLYSREKALQQAYEAWKINKLKYEAGRVAIQDFAQSRQQYESFRAQRIQALDDVLEKDRQLRGLMGLPVEDGTRLVPIDQPNLAPYQPDWHTAVNEALALRPELNLARADLKFRQLDLINQKNQLLPDLRFTSNYGANGLGTRLDGGPNNGNNAFASLASWQFINWGFGLQANIPIGFRDAHAAVRSAQLSLAQSYAVLQDQENKATRYLTNQYRKLSSSYEQIRAQRAQREAATVQLEARFKGFLAGRETLDILLEAQRVWADSLKAEFDNIVAYNGALANFEFAKGTLLKYNNVAILEGPLPTCVQNKAEDYEREQNVSLKIRQRPAPRNYTEQQYGVGTPELPGVYTPTTLDSVPNLQSMFVHPQELPPMTAMPATPPSLPTGVSNAPKTLPAMPTAANPSSGPVTAKPAIGGPMTTAPMTTVPAMPGRGAPTQLPNWMETQPPMPK